MSTSHYGKHLFKGEVAKPYLLSQGLPPDTLESPDWATNGNADKVCLLSSTYFFEVLMAQNVFTIHI